MSMSPVEAVAATSTAVLEIGRFWMLDPATAEHGVRLGLRADTPQDFWVNGRAGVLGEVDAAVACAAIAFVGPALVSELWDGRPDAVTPRAAAVAYAAAAADWGRAAFADVDEDDCAEVAELAQRICAAADMSIGVLFAGWRELDVPDDPRGAATHALQVLRELRGGAHISAVVAAGLTPHQAIMSVDSPTHGGPDRAERFGWPAPHPEPHFVARKEAENLTDSVVTAAYAAALDGEELDRFAELVTTLRSHLD